MSTEQTAPERTTHAERRPSAWRSWQLGIKRLADVVVSLAVLVLGWPLFLLVAVLVRLSSPGPVLFIQERVGKEEKPFRLVKFRSMLVSEEEDAETGWTEAHEARITPIGRLLRDYGLDELSQAWNILKGEMSIIGPRPPLPAQVESFTERQRKMFLMRPGLLSLPGFKGRRSLPMEERIELHVQYVEHWSLLLDFVILLRCIPVILRRQNVDERTTS